MRGLTADEADELDANNELSMCNCGPNGEPGAFVRRPIVTERLVRQGRAEWVSCPYGVEHFCLTGNGREALRIHRFIRVLHYR